MGGLANEARQKKDAVLVAFLPEDLLLDYCRSRRDAGHDNSNKNHEGIVYIVRISSHRLVQYDYCIGGMAGHFLQTIGWWHHLVAFGVLLARLGMIPLQGACISSENNIFYDTRGTVWCERYCQY